jgi:hypothetical protein
MQYLEKTLKLTYEEGIQMLKVQTGIYLLISAAYTWRHEINLVVCASDPKFVSI